ncbi:tetratricopeptide repeat protein [Pseudohongiella sp. SYSU M77423]|uniref:YfgM family protein n=1 Tax=unclassified Pseudohongiella TaxID=2629611 RepID=UPI001F26576D|nr:MULTISPECIES: tetratricopeptide repeat protein [unclassified Pseudohongiella]MDH7943538.1 tetratricopeptide repeat protein [Pseudohongiella sp. SYSU M77423]
MALSAAEEETLESLKRWWHESGRLLALGIAVVAAVYFGWQFWQSSQQSAAAEASAVYDRLSTLAVTNPGELIPAEGHDEIRQLTAELKNEHSSSVYALYGALFAARLAVETDDLATARQELEWLLANTQSGMFNSTEPTLIRLAQLRLGQVMLASGETDEALALISTVDGQALQSEFDELRGDIYLAQGNHEQALAAYESAQGAGNMSPVLQMKMSELQGSR